MCRTRCNERVTKCRRRKKFLAKIERFADKQKPRQPMHQKWISGVLWNLSSFKWAAAPPVTQVVLVVGKRLLT